MNTTIASSEQLIKLLFTTATLPTRPATWEAALFTGNPGLDGASNECADANYARQSVAFTASQPSAGQLWQVDNDADVTFPAFAAGQTITHVGVFSGAGVALAVFELPLSRTLPAAGVLSIPAGELVIKGE